MEELKTFYFANGTEGSYFFENNCWECKKYDWGDINKRCPIARKFETLKELTEEELKEYFDGKPVRAWSKCIKFERVEE